MQNMLRFWHLSMNSEGLGEMLEGYFADITSRIWDICSRTGTPCIICRWFPQKVFSLSTNCKTFRFWDFNFGEEDKIVWLFLMWQGRHDKVYTRWQGDWFFNPRNHCGNGQTWIYRPCFASCFCGGFNLLGSLLIIPSLFFID